MRQALSGNDTYESFERCIYNAVLANLFEQKMDVKIISPKRTSSSGSILNEIDSDDVISCNLSLALHILAKFNFNSNT